MDNQPATNSLKGLLMRFWPWLVLLLIILFVSFIRFRLLDSPLERDEGEYAYAGQLILQGIPPYELAYNMKLPGTYYAYALGMAIFGETATGIHLTLMVVNDLTIIFVFLLGRKLFGVTAGLVAGASYGVLSASPGVLGMAAHATQFVVLFAVSATLMLLRVYEDKRALNLFFSGLLYGLAFLMAQQGICFCLFGGVYFIWRAVMDKTIFPAEFFKSALVLGLGMILPIGLFSLCCAIAGDFQVFWFWTFVYAREYATMLPFSMGTHQLGKHLRLTMDESAGLWIIAAIGLLTVWLNTNLRKQALLVMLFWLCSFFGAALGFYFRPHYFVLVLPSFALALGMTVVFMQRMLLSVRMRNVLPVVPLFLIMLFLCWNVYSQRTYYFQLSPVQDSQLTYRENPVVESIQAAKYIREHSASDARIAVVGSEPQIYFYAHRHSATGYIYTYALMEPQPAALAMQHEMMQEIETNHPEYLVGVSYELSWLFRPSSKRAILEWFRQYAARNYEAVGFIHRNAADKIESFWGDAAKAHLNDGGQYLAIYKRRPDSATR